MLKNFLCNAFKSIIDIVRKHFKKAGIIFMIISLLGSTGCDSINGDTAREIEDLLGKKYGETFVVDSIGNRLNTDSVTAYCYSKNNMDLIFTAVMKNDKQTISDNYIHRVIGCKVEDIVISTFNEKKIDVQGIANIFDSNGMPTSSNISLIDFINQYNPKMFIFNMVLSDSLKSPATSEIFIKALNNIYSKILVDIQFKIKVIPASKFDKCKEWLETESNFNETVIEERYGILQRLTVDITFDGVKFIDNFYDRR